MSAPRVVCFDLGGVLVRICRSWQDACARAGVAVHDVPAEFDQARRAAGDAYQLGQLSDDDYYARVARASGSRYTAADVAAVHHAWTQREYAGIAALIDELSRRSRVRLACLSNTNAAHWARLACDGSAPALEYPSVSRLEIRLASHLLGLAKPDPRIYRAAEQTLGVTGPEIVFFDDLEPNIDAARKVGWHAFAIDPDADPARQMRAELARLSVI